MIGSYDVWLVALSVAVAILASYTALDLAANELVNLSLARGQGF